PMTEQGDFGYRQVNVDEQRRDEGSLLNWMERMIRLRKLTPEIGWGASRVLDAGQPQVLAHRCDWGGTTLIAVHNLSSEPLKVQVDLEDADKLSRLSVEAGGESAERFQAGELAFELEGYGYRWLRNQAP
ncbi:MAG TPA: trehalose synthase, partial [Thermoanaerobaculia bacterium]|nr:trehalose synthase [Thermoanaerobaculia bacterium]